MCHFFRLILPNYKKLLKISFTINVTVLIHLQIFNKMKKALFFLLTIAGLFSSAVVGFFSSITSRAQNNNALVVRMSTPAGDGAAAEWVGAKKFSMKDR